jgi:hypothetical protein
LTGRFRRRPFVRERAGDAATVGETGQTRFATRANWANLFVVTSKTVFTVEVDSARNLVHTRYSGSVTAQEMKLGVEQVEVLLPQVRKGFTVLADLSDLEVMELECGVHIARMMDLCKTGGVAMVIRVMPDPKKDIGLNILSLVHYRGKVKIITCDTLAEAEKILG